MTENNSDFQTKVRELAALKSGDEVRECYGMSNCAKFVTGGFLCGIPNIDNLGSSAGALCIFSKIQLSPNSELHTAVVIRSKLANLLGRMKAMISSPGDFFADKNNNCALFLYSDGLIYPYNKAKVAFELTPGVLKQLGPGVEPDELYWAVYGNQEDARGGAVAQLEALVGTGKFKRVAVTQASPSARGGSSRSDELKSIVETFLAACKAAELRTTAHIVCRIAASLLSKRFLILTGLAGSGKTKVAYAFARWIATDPGWIDSAVRSKGKKFNPQYALIPVGADWTGNENILGYPDGLQPASYITKPSLELLLHATDHSELPHFLILDEMNLSHVERYFADILSAIESEEGMELYAGDMAKPDTWRQTAAGKRVPPRLTKLPENFFIIGTVNVDETTYMFSPKVLDRANVIEFRMMAPELAEFLDKPVPTDLSKLGDFTGEGFGKAFVAAASNRATIPVDVTEDYKAEMLLLFKTLQGHGAEFGYRTAYEAARFIYFYKLLGNFPTGDQPWLPSAFDCVVFQKILPKLHGSRAKLGPVLKRLWFLSVNNASARGADPLTAAEEAARSTDKTAEPSLDIPAGAPYPLSADKIARMWRLLIDNGFASFAEA